MKNERCIYNLLLNQKINFEYQKRVKQFNIEYPNLIIDFYFPNSKLAVEYNGRQHYESVCFGGISTKIANNNLDQQLLRDALLNEICKKQNIHLIWIDGRKYKNLELEQYIINEIIPLTKVSQ